MKKLKLWFYSDDTFSAKRSGFTLIELIITLAILGIVLSVAFSFQYFGMNTFNKGGAKADKQYDVRTAANFISNEIRYAESIEILSSTPAPTVGYNDIYLDSGKIVYNNNGSSRDIIGINDVSDFTLSFTKTTDSLMEFTVGKVGYTSYDLSTEVNIMNLFRMSPYRIIDSAAGPKIGVRYKLGVLSDEDAVKKDKDWLNISNASAVLGDVSLPAFGPNGTNITWTTSNPAVVDIYGTVNRLYSDINVIVTATISKGSASDAKSFTLVIKGTGITISYIVNPNINVTVSKGQSYTMPATVEAMLSDGTAMAVAVTWAPNSIDTSTTGTKASTGTVEYNGTSYTVNLNVNVQEPPPIVDQLKVLSVFTKTTDSKIITITYNKSLSTLNVSATGSAKIKDKSISSNIVSITLQGNYSTSTISLIAVNGDERVNTNLKYNATAKVWEIVP